MHHPLRLGGGGDILTLSDLTVAPLNGTWWGIFALILAVLFLLWFFRGRGRKSANSNRRFLGLLALATLLYLWGYKTLLSLQPDFDFHFWNELPLQPCNVLAALAVLAAVTDWQILKTFCLCAGLPFSAVALLMPVDGFEQVPLLSVNAVGFYGFHGLVLVLAVSFGTLRVCRPRWRDVPGAAGLLVGLGAAAHGVNLLLRATVYPQANYFYTFGLDGNAVLEGLWTLLPVPLVYELPLLLVLLAVCAAAIPLSRLGPGGRESSHSGSAFSYQSRK